MDFRKCSKSKDKLRSHCKYCDREAVKRYRIANREKVANNQKNWRKANPLYSRDWKRSNTNKVSKQTKKWNETNRGHKNSLTMKRYVSKLQQTPKWADLEAISNFYKNCPLGHEVDHIIPLQGKEVRGLHILNNLQYLTISENRKKSNKFKT